MNGKVQSNMKGIGIRISFMIFVGWLFWLATTTSVQADIYKYVDKDGVIHFTNTPLP